MKNGGPLKRKTPLRPGAGLKPKSATTKAPDETPKPPKGPRKRRCQHCKTPFQPFRALEAWCTPECGAEVAKARVARQKAKQQKAERAADKAKLDSMKTYPQLIREVQKEFNLCVRLRDHSQPCICCGRTSDKDHLTGSSWDCGHYRSTGSAPHLRFNFDNAHRQLVYCNRHGAGRAVDYRIGLIARIGLDRVEALEADNTPRKWSREELAEMKQRFRLMAKNLKKEIGNVA